MRSHVLFIGGRSGVGKSTAALALHELLITKDVQHAVIEGDYLDLAHPAPHVAFPTAELAERNLAAMWSAYRTLGYSRLVHTNTVAVTMMPALLRAMGDEPLVTAVLLRSGDAQSHARLSRRNLGRIDAASAERSSAMAHRLDGEAPPSVHRVGTDGRSPSDVATTLLALTGWDT